MNNSPTASSPIFTVEEFNIEKHLISHYFTQDKAEEISKKNNLIERSEKEFQKTFMRKIVTRIKIENENKNNTGSLYNLFNSIFFNIDLLIHYLDKHENRGIIDTLVNLIHKKYIRESFSYLPQLCMLLTYKQEFKTLENYILDMCVDQIKFSLKVYWLINSYLENTTDPKIHNLWYNILQKIEVTLVNCRRSVISNYTHHQKESLVRSSIIFQQSIDKELRLKYFDFCVEFYDKLKTMCEKLKSFPKESDRPNNRNNIMKNYLFVYNSLISNMREEIVADPRFDSNKNSIVKNFFNGIILPIDDNISTFDEYNSIIVRMIPEYSFCFSTKARVPVKICAECITVNESLRWNQLVETEIQLKERPEKEYKYTQDDEILKKIILDTDQVDDVDRDKEQQSKQYITKSLDEYMKEIKLSKEDCDKNLTFPTMNNKNKQEDFVCIDYNHEVVNPFGKPWSESVSQIKESSPFRKFESYCIKNFIAKANDDLRQELMAMQLISKFDQIFTSAGIGLKIRPYEILITSSSSGLIEFLPNTNSIDGVKKKIPPSWNLNNFYRNFFNDSFEEAQKNFAESLAAYSLICYYVQIKDRHNGNILLDMKGNIIHIDFGFILGINPGNVNFENAPFKLTLEYIEILDGLNSPIFEYYKSLMFRGMIEAKRNVDTLVKIVEIMAKGSKMPCFENVDVNVVIQKFRERFFESKPDSEIKKNLDDLINCSYNNFWTNKYDYYQKLTNGIAP